MCLMVSIHNDKEIIDIYDVRWWSIIYLVLVFVLVISVSTSFTVCDSNGLCYVDLSIYFFIIIGIAVLGGCALFIASFHWQKTRFDYRRRRATQTVVSAWTRFKKQHRVVDINRIGRFRTTVQEVLGNDARLMVVAPIIAPDRTLDDSNGPITHVDVLQSKQFYLSIPPRYACGSDLRRNTTFLSCMTCGRDLDNICLLLNTKNEKVTSPGTDDFDGLAYSVTPQGRVAHRDGVQKPAPYSTYAASSVNSDRPKPAPYSTYTVESASSINMSVLHHSEKIV